MIPYILGFIGGICFSFAVIAWLAPDGGEG